jgi:uncharacterized protein with FMN-binding domain
LNESVVGTYECKTAKYVETESVETTEGLYTCIIRNKTSSVQSSCNVVVKGEPQLIVLDKLEKSSEDGGEVYKGTVKAGGEFSFRVQVKGYPKPQVSVLKNKREYSDFTQEESNVVINVRKAQSNDAGVYEVVAKNVAGRAACTFQLTVGGELLLLYCVFFKIVSSVKL